MSRDTLHFYILSPLTPLTPLVPIIFRKKSGYTHELQSRQEMRRKIESAKNAWGSESGGATYKKAACTKPHSALLPAVILLRSAPDAT
jgi:hypothetical protein